MTRATRARRRAVASPATRNALLAIASAALLAASCATPIKIAGDIDPLALLEPGLSAYARLEGAVARRLLPAVLPAEDAASLAPLLERTRVAAIGIGASGGASGDARGETPARALEAAFVGDFPFRGALFAFASNAAWKRDGKAYLHGASGMRATVPGPGLVLASSGAIEPLLARAAEPGASPLPPRLEGLARKELVLWLPDPFARLSLAAAGTEGGMDIPSRGLLVAASPDGGGSYIATVAFLMGDADSARIFKPALRVAWYLLARTLLGEAAGPALGARFDLDGELVLASGVVLTEEALARALGLAVPATPRSLNAPAAR